MTEISNVFRKCKEEGRPAFIPYLTAGYPHPDETVDLLLALQNGGSDVIELGVPFSDPIADGPTIQASSFEALKHGITLKQCLVIVKTARTKGLTVPVILMSYYNPIIAFGEEKLVDECSKEDVDVAGFIVVDMDVDDFRGFSSTCNAKGLVNIPLVAPTTTDDRLKEISEVARGYTYCVSVAGVTGTRTSLPPDLSQYLDRVNKIIPLPRALGFGLNTHDHFRTIKETEICEGVIMGSKVIKTVTASVERKENLSQRCETLKQFVEEIMNGPQ